MNMAGQPVFVTEGNFTTPLAFPTITGANTTLTAQNVSSIINGFGIISSLGYKANGMLGPTIKINSGSSVNINLVNHLNEKNKHSLAWTKNTIKHGWTPRKFN